MGKNDGLSNGFIAMLLSPIAFLSGGVSLMWLWYWFLVPLGLPAIGFWHSAGITLLVGLLTTHSLNDTKDEDYIENYIGLNILVPWLALLFGWIIQNQM